LDVDKDFTDPATACEVPINSCIKKYIRNDASDNISVIIDSDIFLFAPFSFQDYLSSYDISGIVQQREKRTLLAKKNLIYLWNALLVFKNSKTAFDDLDVSIIPGITDVGGQLHYYLKKHQPKIKWMKHTPDIEETEKVIFKEALREKYEANFGMQIIENAFIHYYRGSNWSNDPDEYHQKKGCFLNEFLSYSEKHYPLDISNTEAFNNMAAHSTKHYNGIRNNRNDAFKVNNTF
jgi:hypothetical protein